MARLMSVAFTEDAVRERRKTVTRRKGWEFLKPGDRLTLCRKVMGRKKGEPLVRIVDVEVVAVHREPLDFLLGVYDEGPADYPQREMEREGFPGMDPAEFVRKYFTSAQGIPATAEVTRIEWRYLDEATSFGPGVTDTLDEAALFIARSARPDQSEQEIQQWYRSVIDDADVLTRAFRSAARRLHPDMGGTAVDFRRLQHAKTAIERSRR